MDDIYRCRLDALEQTWGVWGRLGGRGADRAAVVTPEPVSRLGRRRCVRALLAFPLRLSTPPPAAEGAVGVPLTAVELVTRFQAPNGLAHAAAGAIADGTVTEAAAHTWRDLVDRFVVHGPRALQVLRSTEPTLVVRWPVSGDLITMVEALRVVLLEATVHLLDVQRALDHPPEVPPEALRDTVQLLAAIAPPVEFIEAATGRSTQSPLPVLR